jgi:small subunit ribosomal protein S6
MDFAYEINHKKKGYYVVLIAETTASAVAEFERVAGIDKNVIRSLVLNTENLKNYIQTTKLSKTDMTKFDEERRENKKPNFRKNFNRDFKKDFNKDGRADNKDVTPRPKRVEPREGSKKPE